MVKHKPKPIKHKPILQTTASASSTGGAKDHHPLRISLVDLVYGAVIGYGFDRFDVADVDYLKWFLGLLVVSIDWIYVHRKYCEWDYKYNSVFIFDMAILFLMSRLFSSSTFFWIWMGLIFLCYFIWDFLAKQFGVLERKEFIYSLIADLVSAGIFLAAGIYLATHELMAKSITRFGVRCSVAIDAVLIVVYVAAVGAWHYGSKSKPKGAGAR
jgi:hypothetical protein